MKYLFSKVQKARWGDMFSRCVRNNVVRALMLGDDLVGLECPTDVMIAEGDVSRLRRYERCSGEFDGRCVVLKHYRREMLRVAEVNSELAVVNKGFGCFRECDVFSFSWT